MELMSICSYLAKKCFKPKKIFILYFSLFCQSDYDNNYSNVLWKKYDHNDNNELHQKI